MNKNYWIDDLPEEVAETARKCEAPICIIYHDYMAQRAKEGGANASNELESMIWYPDEEICTCYRKRAVKKYLGLKNGNAPKWIRRQRNIKRKARSNDYYFTYEMLTAKRPVFGTTKGLNPEVDRKIQLNRFFKGKTIEPIAS